jgi:hypothetical protein
MRTLWADAEFIRAVLSELMNRSRLRIAIHAVGFAAIACSMVMAHAKKWGQLHANVS